MAKNLDEVLDPLYEATKDPALYTHALDCAADALGVGAVHLLYVDPLNPAYEIRAFTRVSAELEEDYQKHYFAIDYRVPLIAQAPKNQLLLQHDFTREHELKTNPIHRELFPRNGIYELMGAHIGKQGALGWFGVSTVRAHDTFSAEQQHLMRQLIPHMDRSLKLGVELAQSRTFQQATTNLFDHADYGLLLLRNRQVEYMNEKAKSFLNQDGFSLRDGRLSSSYVAYQQRLHRLFEDATREGLAHGVFRESHLEQIYYITVVNRQPQASSGTLEPAESFQVKIVTENRSAAPDPEMVNAFCASFGLSRAEARVINSVLCLEPLDQCAALHDVKLDTLRKQLKSSLLKLDLHSQKELFRLFERYRFALEADLRQCR